MENRQTGFGIVGTGMIAHFHAKAIQQIGNARLVGVYSTTRKKADDFSLQHHCTSYASLEDMLADPGIDILCVCTPSGAHLEPALAGIAAGKHCLIEKPLEITVNRCTRIIDAARESGVKVGVIFPSRFHEASRKIKAAIDSKRFGSLVLGDAYVKWHRTPEYYQSGRWRGTWKYDGGGALMNQGIHSVDLLQWYMGPVRSVQAHAANIRHKDIEVEDTIVASLQFENGALGVIECSTAVFPGSLKRIEILGADGSAILEEDKLIQWEFRHQTPDDQRAMEIEMASSGSSGGAADPSAISYVGHQRQMEDMIEAIHSEAEPFINGEEGRKSVAIIEAIYESARKEEKINL